MHVESEAKMNVAPALRVFAALAFFIIVFLADLNGADGVIAAAGGYALVELTFGAVVMRSTLSRLSFAALLLLVPLLFAVGVLPMLLPPIAALAVGVILALWFSIVGSAIALQASGFRRALGAATLVCSLLALGTVVMASPRELWLLAVTAILAAASVWRFAPHAQVGSDKVP